MCVFGIVCALLAQHFCVNSQPPLSNSIFNNKTKYFRLRLLDEVSQERKIEDSVL